MTSRRNPRCRRVVVSSAVVAAVAVDLMAITVAVVVAVTLHFVIAKDELNTTIYRPSTKGKGCWENRAGEMRVQDQARKQIIMVLMPMTTG